MPTLNPEKGAIETLAYINHELYVMIESSVSIDLLTRLLSTQLLARGEKHLLDRSRVYFRLLKKIVRQGAERGEFRLGLAQEEIVRAFAMWNGHSFTTGACGGRGLLSGGLRGEDDAPVFGEFPSRRINLIFCFSSIPSFCTV